MLYELVEFAGQRFPFELCIYLIHMCPYVTARREVYTDSCNFGSIFLTIMQS